MSSTAGMLGGVVFVVLAGVNVVLMLETGRTNDGRMRDRLILLHRVVGYAFVATFGVMVSAMSQRLIGEGLSRDVPMHLVVHIVLVLGLVPLLLLKILIVRRYPQARVLLMPLGVAIFATAALLVAIPVFSELIRSADAASEGVKAAATLVIGAGFALWVLLMRSAMKRSAASAPALSIARGTKETTGAVPRTSPTPMRLRLVSIISETHDTKTLRFSVPRTSRFRAKPGQFLTFHWIIDGERVVRSYTISSSPACDDHVDITPKRIENGRVSRFLHAEANVGLTVDATGPYGQLYLDEMVHRSVVLIAAGVGITPMISILRYLSDLRLPISATLLYCVRTRHDILFASELDRLRERLPQFTYAVALSRPDESWNGARGRLSRELIVGHVTDLNVPAFFLCGPQGFMESARSVLRSLGVVDSRITEESFGRQSADVGVAEPVADHVATAEFVLSNKLCEFRGASTLLEVAETNGVRIPFGCRQGQCGTCATRVVSGAVHMSTDAGLTATQKSGGYVLACVSRAAGDLIVLG
jgi:ferredoxin-NADP reductase